MTGLRLRSLYRRAGPSLLVSLVGSALSRTAAEPIFLLVPQVKLRKRLDLAGEAERAHDMLLELTVVNWEMAR